jgi:hypothetical protein
MGEAAARRLEDLCGDRDMTAIIQVRGSGYLFGLQSGLPFAGEAWDRVRKLDLAGRLEAISDPQMADRLEREGRIMDFLDPKWVFYLGDGDAPDYAAPVSAHLKAMAEQTGESFIGLFLRLSRESAGRGLFNLRMFCQNLDELGDLLKSRKIFPSLGDAGATFPRSWMRDGRASFSRTGCGGRASIPLRKVSGGSRRGRPACWVCGIAERWLSG